MYEEASEQQSKLKPLFDTDWAKKHNELLTDYLGIKQQLDKA